MSLSPADVRGVEFALARRGYEERQVDDFLDQVVAGLEERDEALANAKRQSAVGGPEETLGSGSEAAHGAQTALDLLALADRTAQEHLAAADATAAEVLATARQEAAAMTADAKQEADRLRAEAEAQHRDALRALHRERRRLEERVGELTHQLEQSRSELETYLTGLLETVQNRESGTGPHALPAISA
jgi:cell division initiation protein